jgi:multiple sugar transport system ATP-binding protein
MRDGEIQQIDTPMALYRAPANVFVATFLGSPAMNLLRGRLAPGEGGAVLTLADGRALPLPGLAADPAWAGRDVDVGVRPEHLLPCADGEAPAFAAEVEVVEPVGSETFATLRCGAQALVARFAPDLPVAPGGSVGLRTAPGRLHVFDAGTGARLSAAG